MNEYSNGRLSRAHTEQPDKTDGLRRTQPVRPVTQPVRPVTQPVRPVTGPVRRPAEPHNEPSEAQDRRDDPADRAQQLAANRAVMLCCTMAAMLSPFAAFLLYAERDSRAIRHNSLQSVALGIIHILGVMACVLVRGLLGDMPVLGMAVSLICILAYTVVLVSVTVVRLKLMLHAWKGLRYDLPLFGWWLERFI